MLKMRSRFFVAPPWLTAITIVAVLTSQPSRAQVEAGRGWIEGAVVNIKNDPAATSCSPGGCSPAKVTIRSVEGKGVYTDTDWPKGGFYTFRDVKPGIYEVFVDKTVFSYKNDDQTYRPVHIFGVVVEANKRTLLNIVVHEGTGIEEVGKPVVPTQRAMIISEEIEKLQRQIDDLRKK